MSYIPSFVSWALESSLIFTVLLSVVYGLDLAEIKRLDGNYEAEDVLGAREPIKVSLVRLNNVQGRRTSI